MEEDKKELRTLLCCIGRKENQYIREYVEYYKGLGFTNVCLYDNNFDGDDDFRDVIGDYIDDGYVILKDYRNRTICQIQAYEECYHEYKDQYDWIAFFDCDEFLTFASEDITSVSQGLSDHKFDDYDMIHVNWMLYEDNGLVRNDGRPVLERFVKPMLPYTKRLRGSIFPENQFTKSIVRGGLPDVKFKTPLSPSNVESCCNGNGEQIISARTVTDMNYEYMYLRHFSEKTIEEFINKFDRGFPDQPHKTPAYKTQFITRFFKVNEPTVEKLEYIKERMGIDLFKYYPNIIKKENEE